MNAKEYLSQVKILDRIVDSELQEIEIIREIAYRVTSNLKEINVVENRNIKSPMESAMTKLFNAEEKINNTIDKLIDLKVEIKENLNKLKNDDYRNILDMRYLKHYDWSVIASKTNYCKRSIYTYHSSALKELEVILRFCKVTNVYKSLH